MTLMSVGTGSSCTGYSLRGRDFISENLALSGGGYTLTGIDSFGAAYENMTTLLEVEWHSKLTDRFWYFGGIGGNWMTHRRMSMFSELGFVYEVGLEYLLGENVMINLGYQYLGATSDLNVSGMHIDISYCY